MPEVEAAQNCIEYDVMKGASRQASVLSVLSACDATLSRGVTSYRKTGLLRNGADGDDDDDDDGVAGLN